MVYFEHFWDCPTCGKQGISALRNRKCPACGYSKTSQDAEHRSQVEITDPTGLALAEGGPHWVCSSCGSVNLDTSKACEQCGNEKEASDHENVTHDYGSVPPPVYTRPDENQVYHVQREEPDPKRSYPEDTLPSYSRSQLLDSVKTTITNPTVIWISIITVVVLLLAFLGWSIFHTRSVQGMVTGFSWSRDIPIERYQVVHHTDETSTPAGAYNVTSVRRSRQEPVYTTKITHHDKTCTGYKDNGNGSEKSYSYDCSYDTSEQVVDHYNTVWTTYYSYDINTWVYERTAHAEGADHKSYWPDYSLNLAGQTVLGAERADAGIEKYIVHFKTNEKDKVKNYDYQTSMSEWSEYSIEHNYTLKINSFATIMNDPLTETKK